MKRLVWLLILVLIVIMGFATFVEQAHNAAYAQARIYHSWWFFALWGVLAVGSGIVLWRQRLWRRTWLFLLHASFLLILVGAAVTFFTSKEGRMRLRIGEQTRTYLVDDHPTPLPVTLRLDDFQIQYYPGTQAPQDFVSQVTYQYDGAPQQAQISMNHILSVGGYRFYQYAPTEDGVVLSITYDPWGTPLTYLAYALLGLSMMGLLFSRRESFRQLLRSPLLRRTMVLLLFVAVGAANAGARSIPTINRQKADRAARLQVIYNDRVAPLSTMAHDFLRKVYGASSYKGLTPEQVVYGWLARPDVWKDEPMILIKDDRLRHTLGIRGDYASLAQLFDGTEYKLTRLLNDQRQKPDKAMMELDEKVGLIIMLTQGQLIRPVPEGTPRLSDLRVEAEILYNHVPFSKLLFMFCLSVGFLAFFHLLWRMTHDAVGPRWPVRLFRISLFVAFAVQLFGYLLHWYIAGRIPLGNGYETMQFLALMLLLLTVWLHRRFSYVLPFGFLLAGFALLVAWLGQRNPQITPLMPVLTSPLLSIHVSVIMMAYALLAFMMLNGLFALILLRRKHLEPLEPLEPLKPFDPLDQLTLLSRLMLFPAVFLLAAGIFLGAVWANVSWGKYWSWDPKEVWALITLLVYAVPFHWDSLPSLRRPVVFHAYMVIAFLTVLMTYFGVNYILGGMHSYA